MLNVVKPTVYFLRATAFQGMNDAGVEIRHIIHMIGHLESSVRTYNRDCSTAQKNLLGDTLCGHTVQNKTMTTPNQERSTSATATPAALSMQSSHFLSSGFMSNKTFIHRVFQFEK